MLAARSLRFRFVFSSGPFPSRAQWNTSSSHRYLNRFAEWRLAPKCYQLVSRNSTCGESCLSSPWVLTSSAHLLPTCTHLCTATAYHTATRTISYLLDLRAQGISLRSLSRSHPHGNRTDCSIGVGGDPRAPRGQRADGLKVEVYPLSFEAQACRSCELVRRSTFSMPK